MDSAESARIIASVFSFFQYFHTCSVDPVQPLNDILLILSFQASAALIIAVHKTVFCYISFISAVTPAVPVYGAAAVPFIRGIQRRQTPETPSCDIDPVVTVVMSPAPAAFYFSGFEVMGRYGFFPAAGTPAQPAGAASAILCSLQDGQIPEDLPCQIFRNTAPAGRLLLNASAVLYRSPGKFSCIRENFSTTVALAPPYNITPLCPVCPLCNCQLSEPLPGQFLSPGHLFIAFLFICL